MRPAAAPCAGAGAGTRAVTKCAASIVLLEPMLIVPPPGLPASMHATQLHTSALSPASLRGGGTAFTLPPEAGVQVCHQASLWRVEFVPCPPARAGSCKRLCLSLRRPIASWWRCRSTDTPPTSSTWSSPCPCPRRCVRAALLLGVGCCCLPCLSPMASASQGLNVMHPSRMLHTCVLHACLVLLCSNGHSHRCGCGCHHRARAWMSGQVWAHH